MTEQEYNSPVTMGILMTVFQEQIKALYPQIDSLSTAIQQRCESYDRILHKMEDIFDSLINNFEVLRAFVIAAYAESKGTSTDKAAKIYNEYAKMFNKTGEKNDYLR